MPHESLRDNVRATQVIATNATQESVLEEMMAKVRYRCLDV